MDNRTNLEIFREREELPYFLDSSLGSYVSLRTAKNKNLLEKTLHYLKQKGPEYVLASWISPPFNKIVGYGIYTEEEAMMLSERSKTEHWGFPRFGRLYRQGDLEKKIKEKQIQCELDYQSFLE